MAAWFPVDLIYCLARCIVNEYLAGTTVISICTYSTWCERRIFGDLFGSLLLVCLESFCTVGSNLWTPLVFFLSFPINRTHKVVWDDCTVFKFIQTQCDGKQKAPLNSKIYLYSELELIQMDRSLSFRSICSLKSVWFSHRMERSAVSRVWLAWAHVNTVAFARS